MSFNLVSGSKVSERGQVVRFLEAGCEIIDSHDKVLATAIKYGSLFLLDCRTSEQLNVAKMSMDVWQKCYGHLNDQSLRPRSQG